MKSVLFEFGQAASSPGSSIAATSASATATPEAASEASSTPEARAPKVGAPSLLGIAMSQRVQFGRLSGPGTAT